MKRNMILLLLMGLISNQIYANINRNSILNFNGNIRDSKNRNITYVAIEYNTEDGFNGGNGRKLLTSKIDKSGNFRFELPDLGKIFCFSFSLQSPDSFLGVSYQYYAESGDNIQMSLKIGELNNDTIVFYGHGCSKYNLITELENQYWKSYHQKVRELKISQFKDSTEFIAKMNSFSKLTREFEGKKNSLINAKPKISNIASNIIKYEYARYFDDWHFKFTNVFLKKYKSYQREIKEYITRNKHDFFYSTSGANMLCTKYLSYLIERIKFDIKESRDSINIVTLYDTLKNSSNNIRDRLLGEFVSSNLSILDLRPFSPVVMDSLILDSEKSIKVSYIKEAIEKKLKLQQGTKLFTSSFIDINGNRFDLESLKDKVFLIDVWFLGCSGCAAFHKLFEERIYPTLKSNKNFTVLSINVDRKYDNWLEGIRSNLYTSPNYINVSTRNGLDHPFIKYYNIKGGPYVMLVDASGHVYSRLEVSQVLDLDNFSRLINGALTVKDVSR